MTPTTPPHAEIRALIADQRWMADGNTFADRRAVARRTADALTALLAENARLREAMGEITDGLEHVGSIVWRVLQSLGTPIRKAS